MFTSANLQTKTDVAAEKTNGTTAAGMLYFTVFAALFGAIYERFSHAVYSYYMIYAFAIPLIGCVLPHTILQGQKAQPPRPVAIKLWNYGIVTLTVGSLAKGALDIYGTTRYLVLIYPVCGLLFCLAALSDQFLVGRSRQQKE